MLVKLCDSPQECKQGECSCEEVELDVEEIDMCDMAACHCDDPGNCVDYNPNQDCCRLDMQDWNIAWEDDSEG